MSEHSEAFTVGFKCYLNGLERHKNPYPPGHDHDEWRKGWEAGYYKEHKL